MSKCICISVDMASVTEASHKNIDGDFLHSISVQFLMPTVPGVIMFSLILMQFRAATDKSADTTILGNLGKGNQHLYLCLDV